MTDQLSRKKVRTCEVWAKRTRDYRPWLLGKLAHPQTAADYLNEARIEKNNPAASEIFHIPRHWAQGV
jgi:hypothetical protein